MGSLLWLFVLAAAGAVAASAACPNEQLRAEEPNGYALRLPDCRAYEQVSPADKNSIDAKGDRGFVQSSPSGEGVTFFSLAPFPSGPEASEVQGSGELITYLSNRGANGWKTQGLLPPSMPERQEPEVLGWTEDLTRTVVLAAKEPLLAEPPPGAALGLVADKYVRDNASATYQWLVGPGEVFIKDATADDQHILFEDSAGKVVPGVNDEEEVPFLYEWNGSKRPEEQVSFIGVVEGGAPELGTVAGGGHAETGYAEHSISDDGARVVFTDEENEHIYIREPEVNRTVAVSAGAAIWRGSTPDGRFAFYTEGEALDRFDLNGETRTELAGPSAAAIGVLGISDDGSIAYFVASKALTTGPNGEGREPVEGDANLYEWRAGQPLTFIAALNPGEDAADWLINAEGEEGKTSRVTPAGTTLMFRSRAQLTEYDNDEHAEIYLFDANRDKLTCLSCNPSGAAATGNAGLLSRESSEALTPAQAGIFLTRNLSEDGSRAFFQTPEALVPQDANGVTDVYEWEREGVGSCEPDSSGYRADLGGCIYLISTGQSSVLSYFGDASADGDDVFFFTRQPLVGQDQDDNADLYDARVEGGLQAQNPAPSPPSCSGEGCRGSSPQPPSFAALGSATLSGEGNLAPPTPPPASTHPKPKPLTRAQKLVKALRQCRKKPRRQRPPCERAARRRYASKAARAKRPHRASRASGGHRS